MIKRLRKSLLVYAKGAGMGAADVVPGVSGGTIALISGIYEELIHAIKSIDRTALKLLFAGKWKALWKHVNGSFLLALFLGIATSVVSLAHLIELLLEDYRILVWSFFFGLVLISSWFVARKISSWNFNRAVALIGGIAVAFYITSVSPAETPDDAWFILLAGLLASCAMILPGISGSFVLLLLGKYTYAISAVKGLDVVPILLLGTGAVVGLLSLSRLLSWLFRTYHDGTLALLAGFMIGSLNKIWPWKETVTSPPVGEESTILVERNVLPSLTDSTDYLLPAIGCILLGIAVILVIEWVSGRKTSGETG